MNARMIPGVTAHAQHRQHERWGSQWSRASWLDVVRQVVDREAVLVRRIGPSRADPNASEVWLVKTPDGPARVVWRPNAALIVTVMGPTSSHNTRNYAADVLGLQKVGATRAASNTHRASRARAESDWRRALRQEDEA